MKRCKWVNLKNPNYVKYHDEEWGVPVHDDQKLFEFLVLELFQAGLTWECILNKRKAFKESFDNFEPKTIANYQAPKINELMKNTNIIRNKRKIEATINNAQIFLKIQKSYESFDKYIWSFTNNQVIKNTTDVFKSTNELSNKISKDLKQKGMKFVGPTIVYSYLQAIGIIDDHELKCYKYINKNCL